jgi:hypothetical protein
MKRFKTQTFKTKKGVVRLFKGFGKLVLHIPPTMSGADLKALNLNLKLK